MAKHASVFVMVKRVLIVVIYPFIIAALQSNPGEQSDPAMIRRHVQELERQIARRLHDPQVVQRARFYAFNRDNVREIVGVIYITDGTSAVRDTKNGSPMFPEHWPAGIYILEQSKLPYRTATVADQECVIVNVRYDINEKKLQDFAGNCG